MWKSNLDEQKDEKHEDEFMHDEISKIIQNVQIKNKTESEKLNVRALEDTIAALRGELIKEFTNYNEFHGHPDSIMDTTLLNIRNAYIHYCKLIIAHVNMIKKDVLTDVSTMFDISNRTLLNYIIYGESAFHVLFTKEENEFEEICQTCSS